MLRVFFFFLEDKCKLAPWEDESFRFLFLFLFFCFFYGKKKFWKTIGLGVFQKERGFFTEGDYEKENEQKQRRGWLETLYFILEKRRQRWEA